MDQKEPHRPATRDYVERVFAALRQAGVLFKWQIRMPQTPYKELQQLRRVLIPI